MKRNAAIYKLVLLCFPLLIGCNRPDLKFKKEEARIEALNAMQQADIDFSNLSRDSGMKKAFLTFIDDEGVLLRPGRLPIIAADAVDFITSVNDSTFVLTWHPTGANIARSADMGYTYGIYEMKMGQQKHSGTYVTIWKKDEDGNWKFCLDSGNEGIEPEDNGNANP